MGWEQLANLIDGSEIFGHRRPDQLRVLACRDDSAGALVRGCDRKMKDRKMGKEILDDIVRLARRSFFCPQFFCQKWYFAKRECQAMAGRHSQTPLSSQRGSVNFKSHISDFETW